GAADPARPAAAAPSATPGAPQAAQDPAPAWRRLAQEMWEGVRDETLSLVRLTRIDAPEAALLAPEQAVFLRRNLELRLLGARVAVLARRHEAAQSDLAAARALLERYFDRRSRAVQAVLQTLRQVAAQARPAALPRPEATLAAIAAVGGR
ncbi:MAG: uroporphyrinogen-III C-methyltransferase, partial [Burkholderiales bacterium]|nr:uroporphyrinogen-III C-methyltransferase [Burkholderiales bacterium]